MAGSTTTRLCPTRSREQSWGVDVTASTPSGAPRVAVGDAPLNQAPIQPDSRRPDSQVDGPKDGRADSQTQAQRGKPGHIRTDVRRDIRRGIRGAIGRVGARDTERGAVSAEAAAVLPVLVALTLGLAWVLSLAVDQIRVVDAAREVARVTARGESLGEARAAGSQIAPAGAEISVRRAGKQVTVTVSAQARGPGGMFRFLPTPTLSSTTHTETEDQ